MLSTAPASTDLAADAGLINQVNAGSAAARLTLAQSVINSAAYRDGEVTSFYANYLHQTCRALSVQECVSTIAVPSAAELSTALTNFASGSSEEEIIAGRARQQPVLRKSRQHAGRPRQGRLPGPARPRADRRRGVGRARQVHRTTRSDTLEFAQAMVRSLAYQDLVVSLDYQQLLLRAPLPGEVVTGARDSRRRRPVAPDARRDRCSSRSSRPPEFYADTGGTPTRALSVHTLPTLLMRRRTTTSEVTGYLHQPLPHDATWQAAVVESIVDSSEYRTDFVRGVYAKYLTYSVCLVTTPQTSDSSGGPASSRTSRADGSGSASSSASSSWAAPARRSSPSSGAVSRASTPTRSRATGSRSGHVWPIASSRTRERVDEYQLEIQSLRRTLARLREADADSGADRGIRDGVPQSQLALQAPRRETLRRGRDGTAPAPTRSRHSGSVTGRCTNVYSFVYDASMELPVDDGRELARRIDETDYAASLLAVLDAED